MMKNIRFYTIAVLFDKQLTPKVKGCLHMDIRHFDIGSHVISCLRELFSALSALNPDKSKVIFLGNQCTTLKKYIYQENTSTPPDLQ